MATRASQALLLSFAVSLGTSATSDDGGASARTHHTITGTAAKHRHVLESDGKDFS